ncbi:MAG: hypothetical protein RLZZ563_1292, partial [Pseudomonadota bacterium]
MVLYARPTGLKMGRDTHHAKPWGNKPTPIRPTIS